VRLERTLPRLGADDVVNLRLALMALLPNVAGLLLAFAAGLTRPDAASAAQPHSHWLRPALRYASPRGRARNSTGRANLADWYRRKR